MRNGYFGFNLEYLTSVFFEYWTAADEESNTWLFIWKVVKLATVVEGDQKAPFSIATSPSCVGRYSISWIAPLDPDLIMPSVKQGNIKYHS